MGGTTGGAVEVGWPPTTPRRELATTGTSFSQPFLPIFFSFFFGGGSCPSVPAMSDSESSSGALPADESTKPVEEETALSEKTTRTSKKEDKKGGWRRYRKLGCCDFLLRPHSSDKQGSSTCLVFRPTCGPPRSVTCWHPTARSVGST